jgi:CCT motif
VWTKKVKYDVRKNFADSRLRVKVRLLCGVVLCVVAWLCAFRTVFPLCFQTVFSTPSFP